MSTLGSVSALLVGMTLSGIAVPALVAVGGLGALAGAYDVMRFVVTESAITRVTMLWAGTRERSTAQLGAGPATPLAAVERDRVQANRPAP